MGEPFSAAGLKIASPCPASWGAMEGGDRSRFCSSCEKHVYNIASMTTPQVMDLIRETEGEFCGRLHRRRDGTVLTADCPVGAKSATRRLLRRAAAGVVLGVGFVTTGAFVRGSSRLEWVDPPSGPGVTFADWKDWALEMIGMRTPPPAQRIMGKIAMPRPPAPGTGAASGNGNCEAGPD